MNDEVWKPVVGYEGYYEVSSLGRIKSLPRVVVYVRDGVKVISYRKERVSKLSRSKIYPHTTLSRGGEKSQARKIHRLVCEAFHGPAPEGKPHVNHKNGVKSDNRAENLEWASHQENIQHAWDTSLIKHHMRGEHNGMSTITEEKVLEIVVLLDNSDMTFIQIAKKFNTTLTTISYINTGRTWNYLTGRASKRTSKDLRFGKNNRKARSIRNCRGEVFDTIRDASIKYNVDDSSIVKACKGKHNTAGKYPDTGERIKWSYCRI